MKIEVKNPAEVVKEAFWLAWQACGGPHGMGAFQDNPTADKEAVWCNAYGKGDYPGGNSGGGNKPGRVHGDYVFGRMMKLCISWTETEIDVPEGNPRPDYQSWSCKFATYEDLIEAADRNVNTPTDPPG